MFYFKNGSVVLFMIGFVSFISKINYTAFALFVLFYFIQVLLSGVSSAIRESFTHARQHILCLVWIALKLARFRKLHIHWLEIRCGTHHISHNYLTSISQVLTSSHKLSQAFISFHKLSQASIYRLELSVWVTPQTERVVELSKILRLNKSLALLFSVISRQHGNNN